MVTIGWRILVQIIQNRDFSFTQNIAKNFVIVGDTEESERVLNLVRAAEVYNNFIGTVSPNQDFDNKTFLGGFHQIEEIVQIYKINEIIFCSKDVPAYEITKLMTKIGGSVEYKIVPEESLSIIGSRSKNTAGQLYTIEIQFDIIQPMHQRNKRFIDMVFSLFLLITFPISFLIIKRKFGFIKNLFAVLFRQKSWVGYYKNENLHQDLPKIRKGVLSPIDGLKNLKITDATIHRLNLLYAKDYSVYNDLEILKRGFRELGQ